MTPPAPGLFRGAVLAGGRSRRMGVDKAFVEIDGTPMIVRAIAALETAGAAPVEVIGGDGSRLTELGLTVVADRYPGQGPLGGVVTALARSGGDGPPITVVLPCDVRAPSSSAIRRVVTALEADPGAAVAVPEVVGRLQWLHAAWRPEPSLARLAAAFDEGERSLRGAAEGLQRVVVTRIDVEAVADVDTPDDLAERPEGE